MVCHGVHDAHMVANCTTSQLKSWFVMVPMTLTWLQIALLLSSNHVFCVFHALEPHPRPFQIAAVNPEVDHPSCP